MCCQTNPTHRHACTPSLSLDDLTEIFILNSVFAGAHYRPEGGAGFRYRMRGSLGQGPGTEGALGSPRCCRMNAGASAATEGLPSLFSSTKDQGRVRQLAALESERREGLSSRAYEVTAMEDQLNGWFSSCLRVLALAYLARGRSAAWVAATESPSRTRAARASQL